MFHFNSGSCNGCDIEVLACFSPRYDPERFGIVLVPSPRHADVLLVTGPVTKKAKEKLLTVYHQMPTPKWVLAVGNCAISGGPFATSEKVEGGAEKILPVDFKVIGCPPRPENILSALIHLSRRIGRENEKGRPKKGP